jgi:hypothetical protein
MGQMQTSLPGKHDAKLLKGNKGVLSRISFAPASYPQPDGSRKAISTGPASMSFISSR